jgi:hypothetical protein
VPCQFVAITNRRIGNPPGRQLLPYRRNLGLRVKGVLRDLFMMLVSYIIRNMNMSREIVSGPMHPFCSSVIKLTRHNEFSDGWAGSLEVGFMARKRPVGTTPAGRYIDKPPTSSKTVRQTEPHSCQTFRQMWTSAGHKYSASFRVYDNPLRTPISSGPSSFRLSSRRRTSDRRKSRWRRPCRRHRRRSN